MKTIINGEQYEFAPHPLDTAVDVIREQAGLTGTKMACGGGICGACTVLVNDVPICSCLMPANHMEGKEIQTIEAHGRDNLHPVQRAFMANEGLQCGFCTPGFVNEGIAFYDRWQKEHGKTRPSHHEIALAMGGHLCRCAAYVGIYAAIGDACEGLFDTVTELRAPRVDALEKVTGEAKYTVDTKWPGQLEGKILRSAYPNAVVRNIDDSEALNLNGVFAVVNLMEGKNRVRWVGQPIVGVAAVNERTAEEALRLIKVDYDVKPAVINFDQAMNSNSPEVWDDGHDEVPTSAEGTNLPYRWNNNVGTMRMAMLTSRRSSATERKIDNSSAKNVVERDYRNAQQVHTALEPHAAIAHWEGPKKLRLAVSTQTLRSMRTEVAEHFDLEKEQVTVESHYIGGGFGGKQGLYREAIAAITMAREAGQPVRVADSRLEELAYASLRPGVLTKAAIATQKNGAPQAIRLHSYGDGGISAGTMGSTVSWLMGPSGPVYDMQDYAVTTHRSQGTPYRGPDAPGTLWALEQAIDELAEQHNLSPVEIRRRWWPDHEIKNRLLDWVESIPQWKNLQGKRNNTGRFQRGIGLSLAKWMFIYNSDTEVRVSSSPEGIKVSCSTQDIGNGTRTSIAKAIEDLMGIDRNDVILDIGFADRPNGPTSGGSQVTTSVYPTTYKAGEDVVAHLVKEAKSKLNLNGAKAAKGGVDHSNGFTPWNKVLAVADPFSATDKRGNERGPMGLRINMSGGESAPSIGMRFGHGAVVTEVEVDTRLGKIRPVNVWTAVAVGKIFVKELANSQMYSGVIHGLGYALYEEKVYDNKTGHVISANLNDYRIPGIGDTPDIHIHYDEKGYEEIRGKGIGLSELATVGVASSVGNAVHHATGWRPIKTPITPHDVVTGLKQVNGGQK